MGPPKPSSNGPALCLAEASVQVKEERLACALAAAACAAAAVPSDVGKAQPAAGAVEVVQESVV